MSDKKSDPVTATLPAVELGQVVYWLPGGDPSTAPHVAIVTGVGIQGMLQLNIIDPMMRNLFLKDGVRHVSDPRKKNVEFQENGAWDHSPQTKRLLLLESQIRQLLADTIPSSTTKTEKR